jgi:hypothetical protein
MGCHEGSRFCFDSSAEVHLQRTRGPRIGWCFPAAAIGYALRLHQIKTDNRGSRPRSGSTRISDAELSAELDPRANRQLRGRIRNEAAEPPLSPSKMGRAAVCLARSAATGSSFEGQPEGSPQRRGRPKRPPAQIITGNSVQSFMREGDMMGRGIGTRIPPTPRPETLRHRPVRHHRTWRHRNTALLPPRRSADQPTLRSASEQRRKLVQFRPGKQPQASASRLAINR